MIIKSTQYICEEIIIINIVFVVILCLNNYFIISSLLKGVVFIKIHGFCQVMTMGVGMVFFQRIQCPHLMCIHCIIYKNKQSF